MDRNRDPRRRVRPGDFEQAGVDDADTIAALTELTGLNLAVRLLATQLADGIRTVARVDRETDGAYDRFVDAVVYPEEAGARVAANKTAGREVQTLAAVTGTVEIIEIRVAEGAPATGRTLAEVSFPTLSPVSRTPFPSLAEDFDGATTLQKGMSVRNSTR